MLSTIYSHEEKIKRLEAEIRKLEIHMSHEKPSRFKLSESQSSANVYDFIVPWQM